MKKTSNKEKPEVRVIRMADGSIRIINNDAGARFCGVNPQSFAAFIRRQYARPNEQKQTLTVADKVLAAYPELFENMKD